MTIDAAGFLEDGLAALRFALRPINAGEPLLPSGDIDTVWPAELLGEIGVSTLEPGGPFGLVGAEVLVGALLQCGGKQGAKGIGFLAVRQHAHAADEGEQGRTVVLCSELIQSIEAHLNHRDLWRNETGQKFVMIFYLRLAREDWKDGILQTTVFPKFPKDREV